jgi:hypothetical protein
MVEEGSLVIIATAEGKRFLAKAGLEPTRSKGDTLVIADVASVFTELDELVRKGRHAVVAMFCARKTDMAALADAFTYAERRHVTPFFLPDLATCRRLVLAHQLQAQDKLIAHASVRGDELCVWSCEPRQYVTSLASLPALAHLSKASRSKFTIDRQGSYLHWPEGDVHLDLDGVRYACDAAFRRTADRQTREQLRHYGTAIRALRLEHHLTQSDIAGLTDRQLRRIEGGLVVPHASSLGKLAAAHHMPLGDYLAALAARA